MKKKPNTNEWGIDEDYIQKVTTEYVAVNDQSDDRQTAMRDVMPHHLHNAYDKHITEYTLFHNSTVGMGDTYESFCDKMSGIFTNNMTKHFS